MARFHPPSAVEAVSLFMLCHTFVLSPKGPNPQITRFFLVPFSENPGCEPLLIVQALSLA